MHLAIEAENVTLTRDGQLALEGVSLKVSSGSFLGIIGPNGGGKSTLLKVFAGLLKPDSGMVRVLGHPPAGNQVGYVPQETGFNLSFPITALDVVKMGFLGSVSNRKSVQDGAIMALERVGIAHLSSRRVGTLSGGERQRTFIARALCGQTKLLLLDEPTANLDPQGQEGIYELLKSLQPEITIVLVSHDISHLIGYATSVVALNRKLLHHECLPGNARFQRADGHVCEVELLSALLKSSECD